MNPVVPPVVYYTPASNNLYSSHETWFGVEASLLTFYHFFKRWQSRVQRKQWPLTGEFSKFEYSPKIRQIFVTRSGEFGEYWANFCDSLQQIWWELSKFSEFSEFGESGEFGEDRLDRFIPKNIFFLYIKRPSLKIHQNAVTDSPDSHSPKCGHLWYSPDSPTLALASFWEKCDSPRHIRTSNSPFWRIWGEWPLLNNNPSLFTLTYLIPKLHDLFNLFYRLESST